MIPWYPKQILLQCEEAEKCIFDVNPSGQPDRFFPVFFLNPSLRFFVINLIPLIVDLPAASCQVRWSFRQILRFCCFCVSFVHHQPGDLLGLKRQLNGNHGRILCLFVFYCYCYFNLCPSGSTLWRSHNPDVVFAKLVNRTLSWKLKWLSWKIQGWNFHFHVQNLVLE